MRKQRAFTTQ